MAFPRAIVGSRLTKNKPSASITVGTFVSRANAKMSQTNANASCSRPSPGPITSASMFFSHLFVFRTPSSKRKRSRALKASSAPSRVNVFCAGGVSSPVSAVSARDASKT